MNTEILTEKEMHSIIESILFAWAEPLSLYKISKILNQKPNAVESMLHEMMLTYKREKRGIQIIETNKHYQFCTLDRKSVV